VDFDISFESIEKGVAATEIRRITRDEAIGEGNCQASKIADADFDLAAIGHHD
jgi:hypothetical protein